MGLTPKKVDFCKLVGSGMAVHHAFRRAFREYRNASGEDVIRYSEEMLKDIAVAETIAELQEENGFDTRRDKEDWTRERVIRALGDVAEENAGTRDAVPALKEIASICGFNAPKKLDVVSNAVVFMHGTDVDL
jgi:hypothetical protein